MTWPDEYAYIKGTQHNVLGGRGYVTFEWDGPKDRPVLISRWLLDDAPDLLRELPWRLRKIDEDVLQDAYLYVRCDRFGALAAARHFWRNFGVSIMARTVLTLHVWGLAYVPPGVMPHWRNIRLRKRKDETL